MTSHLKLLFFPLKYDNGISVTVLKVFMSLLSSPYHVTSFRAGALKLGRKLLELLILVLIMFTLEQVPNNSKLYLFSPSLSLFCHKRTNGDELALQRLDLTFHDIS